MILYGYQCRECGQEYTSEYRGNVLMMPNHDDMEYEHSDGNGYHIVLCGQCNNFPIKRKYSVSVHRPMARHFNKSVGKEIGSERQFRDELKRKGELESLRTGIDNDYEPVDPSVAREAVEKSGAQGLESTNRVHVNDGKRPIHV